MTMVIQQQAPTPFRIVATGPTWLGAVIVAADTEGLLADRAGQSSPQLKWRVEGSGLATPVADPHTVYFLSHRHEVLAVERATGTTTWRRGTGDSPRETPGAYLAISGELLIVGDHSILALEKETGTMRWRFDPDEGRGPGVFVGVVDDRHVLAGSPSGHLHAVQTSTGRRVWSVRLADQDNGIVYQPRQDDDLAFASTVSFHPALSGSLVAVELVSGHIRWRAALRGSVPAGPPVLAGDELVVPMRDGVLVVFDKRTGQVRSQFPRARAGERFTDQDVRALALHERVLIAGSLAGMVTAYDLDSGDILWEKSQAAASTGFVISAAGGKAYVPFLSGEVVALDVRTGREHWRFGGPDVGLLRPPLVAGHEVFMSGSVGGFLHVTVSDLFRGQ